MKKYLIATLMVATLAVAFSLPHMPESDGKLLINLCLGILIFFTIRTIWLTDPPKAKPAAWGVITTAKSTPILKGK